MRRILLAFLALLFLSSTGYLEKFGLAKHHHRSNYNHQQSNYSQISSNSAHY